MTYVEKILRMQAEVAAELQPEADEALTVYHWSVGVRPEAGTQDAETEPGTAEAQSLPADMQTPDRPDADGGRTAAADASADAERAAVGAGGQRVFRRTDRAAHTDAGNGGRFQHSGAALHGRNFPLL